MAKISAYSAAPARTEDDFFIIERLGVNFKIALPKIVAYSPANPSDWGSPQPATYDEAIDALAGGFAAGIPDADYGDITVTAGTWTIDNGVVSTAKMGGDVTAAGKALLTAADQAAQRAILDLEVGVDVQQYDADLAAVAALASTGMLSRTAAGAMATRTITGTANEITVTDGDGVAGNPTVSLPTVIDLGGKTSLEIPNSAAPTVNVDGQVAVDTTVTDFSHGLIKYYSGEELAVVAMPVAQVSSPAHLAFPAYDSAADEFQMKTLADLQGTGSSSSAAGFRGLPVNSQSGNYTTVLSDVGKSIRHPSGAGAGDTFTIDSQANVNWPDGAPLTFENRDSNALTIAATTDTLRWAQTGGTGSRTLAQYGIATAVFDDAINEWLISGTGLT